MKRFTGILLICFAAVLLLSDKMVKCQDLDDQEQVEQLRFDPDQEIQEQQQERIEEIGEEELRTFEEQVIDAISQDPLRQLRIKQTVRELSEETQETLRQLFPDLTEQLISE
jgi:hypothetical protein